LVAKRRKVKMFRGGLSRRKSTKEKGKILNDANGLQQPKRFADKQCGKPLQMGGPEKEKGDEGGGGKGEVGEGEI